MLNHILIYLYGLKPWKKITSILSLIIIIYLISLIIPNDLFRSTKRIVNSQEKILTSEIDRTSFKNEVAALVTYGKTNKDIHVVYSAKLDEDRNISSLSEIKANLPANYPLKIVNIKEEVKPFEGQGFIEVQFPNGNGSYVTSPKYWIEADYVIINPTEQVDKIKESDNNSNIKTQEYTRTQSYQENHYSGERPPKLNYGEHLFKLKKGEVTDWYCFPDSKYYYSIYSLTPNKNLRTYFRLLFNDGTKYNVLRDAIPFKGSTPFKISSLIDQTIKLEIRNKLE